jgi:hypothetical protein
LYIGYITNFKNANNEVVAEKKRNKKFKELCSSKHKILQKEGFSITNLESFLITPVQRIPRYRLLLEELLSNIDTTNECYQQIQAAAEFMAQIAMYCNEKSSNIDKSARIIEIADKLRLDRMIFVKPSRRFICEELDSVKLLKGKKRIACDVYLFSDILLIAKFPVSIFGIKAKKPSIQYMSLKIGSQCPEKKNQEVGHITVSPLHNTPYEDVGLSIRCYYKTPKNDFSVSGSNLTQPLSSTRGMYEIKLVCDSEEQATRLRESI